MSYPCIAQAATTSTMGPVSCLRGCRVAQPRRARVYRERGESGESACVSSRGPCPPSLCPAPRYTLGSRLGLCGRGSPGPPLRRLGEGLGASPSGDQASTGTALGLRLGAHSAGYKPAPNAFYLNVVKLKHPVHKRDSIFVFFVHVSVTAQEGRSQLLTSKKHIGQ